MKNKLTPALRYSQFKSDWVQHRLSELATIVRGSSPRPIKDPKWFSEDSNIGWLRIFDVTKQQGCIHTLDQHLSPAGQEKTRVVTAPHLLLSIAASVGYPVITYIATGVHDGFVIFQKPIFDLNFMFFWLENYRPYWKKYEQVGSQINLNTQLVANTKIYLPIGKEQEKLAEQFLKIDHLIVLEEKRLNNLLMVNKNLLENIFVSEKGKKPKVRFKKYTKNWQLYKLGDFGKVATNKRIFKKQTSAVGDVPFYKIGTFGKKADAYIDRKLFLEYKDKYPYPKTGNLLLSASGSIGRVIEYNGEDAYYQDSNIVWLDHDDRILDSFLKPAYKVIHWSGIEGSTIKRLYNKNIMATKIRVPEKDEQEKIGSFFEKLERLISLQKSKIEKFKKIKNFLLQKMFIV